MSLEAYMFRKLWTKFFNWLSKTKFYYHILMNVVPYIRFTTYYTSMKGRIFHKMYNLLKPGHIILTIDKKKLTTVLVPGEFSHAALCVSKDKVWEVSEMTHKNYTKSTFADVCFESDRVVILECPDFTRDYIQQVVEKCKSFEDAKYDTAFHLGVEALYCSELVYQSDFMQILDVSLEDQVGLNTPYISPTGLYRATNLTVVYDSDWDLKEEDEEDH